MLDAVALVDGVANEFSLGTEMIKVFERSSLHYLIAGLRRQMLSAVRSVQ